MTSVTDFLIWFYDRRVRGGGAWRPFDRPYAELQEAKNETARFTSEFDWYIEKRVRTIVAKHYVNKDFWGAR